MMKKTQRVARSGSMKSIRCAPPLRFFQGPHLRSRLGHLENQQLFQPVPLPDRIRGRLAALEAELALAEKGQRFVNGDGEGRAARVLVQGEQERGISATRLDQPS